MKRLSAVIGALCSMPSIATAASLIPAQCEKALVPNIESGFFSESDRYLFLYTLDQASFDRIRKNLDSGTQLVVYGIPVKQDTKWSDFHQAAQSKLESVKIEANRDVATQWYSSKLTRDNFAAYSECLRKDAAGFTAFVQDVSGNLITASAVFHTANGDVAPRKVQIQVANATLLTKGEKTMTNGSEQSWIIQRVAPGPIAVLFDVSVGKFDNAYSLPIITEPPVVKVPKTEIILAQTLYNPAVPAAPDKAAKGPEYEPGAYVNAQMPDKSTLCYYAPVGYKILPKSDTLVWHDEAGAKMSDKRIDEQSTEEHVCYALVAQSNADGHGSGIAQIRLRVATDKVEYVELK